MFRKTLFSNIFILIILAFLVIGSVFLAFIIEERTKTLKEMIVKENKLIVETVVSIIKNVKPDHVFPIETLDKISKSDNVYFLWIVKPDGEIYYADDPKIAGKIIDSPFLGKKADMIVQEMETSGTVYPRDEKKMELVVSSFEVEGDGIWSLFVGSSLKKVAQSQREIIFFGLGVLIFCIIFIIFLSLYFLKKVTQPLERLREEANYRIGLSPVETGGDVTSTLSQMMKDLENYQEILEESKAVLEIRVNARTRQLKELANTLEGKVKKRTKILEDSREALLNILEDVEEERKTAEEEKDKTLAIIENFTDGLLVLDAENMLVLINAKAEEFLAVNNNKLINKSIEEIFKNPEFKDFIDLFNKKNKKVFKEELTINGNLVLEVVAVPMIKDEKIIGSLIILHDVTKEKLIEKMKTEFVSLAAHQLRTPLSGIKWTLKMFLDNDLGKISKEQREFLKDTYKSNEKMIALVNDLLNVTKIQEGKYVYKLSPANIDGLVGSVIRLYEESAAKKKIKLKFKKPRKKVPNIAMDIEKIKIVIDNIISNAITYTPIGGKIIASLEINKKNVRFSVEDTGVGIPKDQQKRIFTKFFRGINVAEMDTEGTGLGMFISKSIIEAHGGEIGFKSIEGVGTTFFFTLPIKNNN